MSYDDDWPDESLEMRKQVVRQTMHPVTSSEVRALCERLVPPSTDPWFEQFNDLLEKHPHARYYQAETPDDAIIVYCRDVNQGVWFLPGSGMGIIQPRGLGYLKEIADSL